MALAPDPTVTAEPALAPETTTPSPHAGLTLDEMFAAGPPPDEGVPTDAGTPPGGLAPTETAPPAPGSHADFKLGTTTHQIPPEVAQFIDGLKARQSEFNQTQAMLQRIETLQKQHGEMAKSAAQPEQTQQNVDPAAVSANIMAADRAIFGETEGQGTLAKIFEDYGTVIRQEIETQYIAPLVRILNDELVPELKGLNEATEGTRELRAITQIMTDGGIAGDPKAALDAAYQIRTDAQANGRQLTYEALLHQGVMAMMRAGNGHSAAPAATPGAPVPLRRSPPPGGSTAGAPPPVPKAAGGIGRPISDSERIKKGLAELAQGDTRNIYAQ